MGKGPRTGTPKGGGERGDTAVPGDIDVRWEQGDMAGTRGDAGPVMGTRVQM